jgi:hypothetical protein
MVRAFVVVGGQKLPRNGRAVKARVQEADVRKNEIEEPPRTK